MISLSEPYRVAPKPMILLSLVALVSLGLASVLLASSPLSPGSAAALAGTETAHSDESNVQTDPVDGAKLTRPARSLRVWFDRAPVVAKSQLALEGPMGSMQVEGLHTMGEDDLMARVVGAMPNGSYQASYTATFADGESITGTWSFEIQRPGQASR